MMKPTIINEKDLKFIEALAKKVGKYLITQQKKINTLKVHYKEAQGVASTADVNAEKMIIKEIKKKYPKHEFLAEESAYEKFQGESEKYNFLKEKEFVWIIDPLDGTNNFLNGLDYFAICISLVSFGKPILGIVYRPVQGDMFLAIKNKGAIYKNIKTRKSMKVKASKNKKKLSESLLVTGFTSEKGILFDREFDLFKKMMGKSRGIRRMGSAALDLCYVAFGIFDAFWERGLAPWDVSAAGLICLESGISVSNYEGEEFHPFQSTILAAKANIKEEISQIMHNG